MTDSDILAAALRYAAAGVHVFPTRIGIRGDGKKEVYPIAAWKQASTTDPTIIASWWGAAGTRRDSALCIDCGKSGIVMIDQDISDGKQGPLEWEKLSPPPTWRVRSGSGGGHDYYRADPSRPVTVDNDGAIADGVDVRGEGGFAFAPPSIDPRGGMWEWVDGEPDWPNLPPVPVVVLDRMEAKQAGKRPKPSPGQQLTRVEPATFTAPDAATSILFANPSDLDDRDFGPDGGHKTRSAALALLSEQHRRFVALTGEGNARSHILSQEFGVLAGHGVGVFWEYEWAFEQLMQAARDNGMCDVHGERYVADQARRGLEFGMREPWHEIPSPTEALAAAVTATPADAVDALLAEMVTLDQLENARPPRFLVHRFLQFDSESWVIGMPGSKKSFIVFDIAARVVRGEPWQGFKTNPADVVFIVAEGVSGHGKRVKAWQQRNGRVERDARQAVFTLPRPVQVTELTAWAVLVRACGRLADRAREAGRGLLVVIDTQSRVTAGLDENKNGADGMNTYVQAVSAIRHATGACVLSIHHTGKDGRTTRGGSVLNGAQTTELKVESASGKLTGRLLTEKQKDVDEHAPVELAFEVVDVGVDEDGERLSSLVLAAPGSAEFIAAWASAETTHEEVAEADAAKSTPFKTRVAPDAWVVDFAERHATVQHWAVQALVDTAETLGLTQSEVRGLVEERRGKLDNSTWRKAWQRITEDGGAWSAVVVAASGQRWTVDRVAVGALDK
jgi:hypothetical protein